VNEGDSGDVCYIDFADSIKYLGTVIHCSLSSEPEIAKRIAGASAAFGAVGNCLLRSKLLNMEDKGRLFNSLVVSILLYGSECWTLTSVLHRRVKSFYNRCVRIMCRCTNWNTTKCQRITSRSLAGRLGLKTLDDLLVKRQLTWVGRVWNMPMSRVTRRLMFSECESPGPRVRGGSDPKWWSSIKVSLRATFGEEWKGLWRSAAENPAQWSAAKIQHSYYSSPAPPDPPPAPPVVATAVAAPVRWHHATGPSHQLNPNPATFNPATVRARDNGMATGFVALSRAEMAAAGWFN
jgi:hypothetical protein